MTYDEIIENEIELALLEQTDASAEDHDCHLSPDDGCTCVTWFE